MKALASSGSSRKGPVRLDRPTSAGTADSGAAETFRNWGIPLGLRWSTSSRSKQSENMSLCVVELKHPIVARGSSWVAA